MYVIVPIIVLYRLGSMVTASILSWTVAEILFTAIGARSHVCG
jgi:hypothetical protein